MPIGQLTYRPVLMTKPRGQDPIELAIAPQGKDLYYWLEKNQAISHGKSLALLFNPVLDVIGDDGVIYSKNKYRKGKT